MILSIAITSKYLSMCENEKKLDFKTIKAYRIDLRQFLEYLEGEKRVFDRESIKGYLAEMNKKYKPRTVKRKIASIRALCTWLETEELLPDNPFARLRVRVQTPLLLPRVIPLREAEGILRAAHALLDQFPDDQAALCGTAAMELLFATGVRVSELCGLQTKDIDLADGVIRIFGKGAKERVIQLTNPEVLGVLRRYAEVFRPDRNGAFFRNRRGRRLSEQSVRRMLRKYAELAGIATRVTPHMLRHTLATLLLEEDVDIRYIQHLLGHASILTTQIYTHVAGAKQREIMITSHPRNKFTFL